MQKKTFLRDRSKCDVSPPFIDCHCFVPNKAHERGFFPITQQVPNLRLIEHVIAWEIALPFTSHTCGSPVPINDIVSAKLSGIVMKLESVHPSPSIWVPPKSGHLTIEKASFFLFTFLFRPSNGVDNFSFVEEIGHLPCGIFPFPKAPGVGANRETLYRKWQREML